MNLVEIPLMLVHVRLGIGPTNFLIRPDRYQTGPLLEQTTEKTRQSKARFGPFKKKTNPRSCLEQTFSSQLSFERELYHQPL